MYRIAGSDRSPATLYRGAVDRDALGVPLHRFTVKQLHRMRETGVIPPRARVELLAGILVDMHRPTARELEATRRIAGVLAEDVRFNVRDFDHMLEIGILADVQRHELLDGVVLDLDVDAQARAARVAADVAARLPPLKALLEEREVSR